MNIQALKAAFVLAGYDIKGASEALGIPASTMYRKLKHEDFTIKEANLMIRTFNIVNPTEVFFEGR